MAPPTENNRGSCLERFRNLSSMSGNAIQMSRQIIKIFSHNYRKFSVASERSTVGTIYALSSGHGKCGVSVFRVSGPNARHALVKICKFKWQQLPKPRFTSYKRLFDPESNQLLDKGLVIWFPGPNSFTGEDCCEFHVHGGIAVQAAVLDAFAKLPKFRPAEAGEFTKRAFYNGKLDLTEIEGLADIINAETEAQRKQAVMQLDGVLSQQYQTWSQELIQCLAHLEAFIDFGEDEIIEDSVAKLAVERGLNLIPEIQSHLKDDRRGERLRNGVAIAIVGEPNVGKSTLLNAICRRPIAIVSSLVGTTRDVINVAFDISGYPVVFSDTAGLRQTEDVVEREGIVRAKTTASNADIVVIVLDATQLVSLNGENLLENLIRIQEQLKADVGCKFNPECKIAVVNKIDLLTCSGKLLVLKQLPEDVITISCQTGENMDSFVKFLTKKIKTLCINPSGNIPLLNGRHRQHLTTCLAALEEFSNIHQTDVVLAAEYVRKALRSIGKITGKVTPEDILDVLFKDFCIGK